jgi:hypothetical protein
MTIGGAHPINLVLGPLMVAGDNRVRYWDD